MGLTSFDDDDDEDDDGCGNVMMNILFVDTELDHRIQLLSSYECPIDSCFPVVCHGGGVLWCFGWWNG